MDNLQTQSSTSIERQPVAKSEAKEKVLLNKEQALLFKKVFSGLLEGTKKEDMPDFSAELQAADKESREKIHDALSLYQKKLDEWTENVEAKKVEAAGNATKLAEIEKLFEEKERKTKATEAMFDQLMKVEESAGKRAEEAAARIPSLKALEKPIPVVSDDAEWEAAKATQQAETLKAAAKNIEIATEKFKAEELAQKPSSEVLASNWPAAQEVKAQEAPVLVQEAPAQNTEALKTEYEAKKKEYNEAMGKGDVNAMQGLRVEMRELIKKLGTAAALQVQEAPKAPVQAEQPAPKAEAPKQEMSALEIPIETDAKFAEIQIPIDTESAPENITPPKEYGRVKGRKIQLAGSRYMRAVEADKYNMRAGEPDPVDEAFEAKLSPEEEEKASNVQMVVERFKELPGWLKKGMAKMFAKKAESAPAESESSKTLIIDRPLENDLNQEQIAKLSLQLQDEMIAKNPGLEADIMKLSPKQTEPSMDFNQIRAELRSADAPIKRKMQLLSELNYRQEQARDFGRGVTPPWKQRQAE